MKDCNPRSLGQSAWIPGLITTFTVTCRGFVDRIVDDDLRWVMQRNLPIRMNGVRSSLSQRLF